MGETIRSNATRDRLARLLRLILSLRTERFPNANDLAVSCEVSRRTIFRDVDVLRLAGFPVTYRADRQGYQIVSAQAQPAALNEREALALLIFSRQAGIVGGSLGNVASEAARKIVNSLGDETRRRVVELSELIILDESFASLDDREAAIHDVLVSALSTRKQARVRLNPAANDQGEVELTKLSPYRLATVRGAWRLIARSSWHRRVVFLGLDAIREIELTEDPYEIPPRFDHTRFLDSVVGTRSRPLQYPIPISKGRLRTKNASASSDLSKVADRKDRSVVDAANDLVTIGLRKHRGA